MRVISFKGYQVGRVGKACFEKVVLYQSRSQNIFNMVTRCMLSSLIFEILYFRVNLSQNRFLLV